MPLCTDNAETACLDNLQFFFFRLFLVRIVELTITLAHSLNFFAYFGKSARLFDYVALDTLLSQPLFCKIFRVTAKQNIRTASGHVRCDRDCAKATRLRNNFRLAFVVFRVQNIMFDTVAEKQTGNLFRFFNGNRTDENRLTFFVTLRDFADDCHLFSLFRLVNFIALINTTDRLVCRNNDNVKRIYGTEFTFLRLCRTRHTRKLFIETEIILERNGRKSFILLANFNAFLRFDRLMQTV